MKVQDLKPIFGSKAEIARQLGVSRQVVTYWADNDIPEVHALKMKYEILPSRLSSKVNPPVEQSTLAP